MLEKLQTGEKIHDAPRQPRTCSHPIYARTLTGVCQAIRIFSPCFFHVFISIDGAVCDCKAAMVFDEDRSLLSFNYHIS